MAFVIYRKRRKQYPPESGITLVETMISLALAGVVVVLGAQFFSSSQETSGTEQAVLSLQRQADRIHNLLLMQIESAGFGFPQSCANSGMVLANWPGSSGLSDTNAWYPVAGTPAGGLSLLESSNALGNVALTTITSMPSVQADSFQVISTQNLGSGDGLAVEIPGTACFASVIHSASMNSGKEVTYVKYNGASFGSMAQQAGISISPAQMTNARVYDLGKITATTISQTGTSLQETLSSQSTNWQPQTVTLSNRVLGWDVQVGTGAPLQWEPAAQWASQANSGAANPILAVQVGMVLASQNAYPHAHTPSQVSLLGKSIPVSTTWQGHLLKSFVWTFAVRNAIWENGNG